MAAKPSSMLGGGGWGYFGNQTICGFWRIPALEPYSYGVSLRGVARFSRA